MCVAILQPVGGKLVLNFQITDKIQNLLKVIAETERIMTRNRDQLLPELDATIRARRMQQAYRRKT